jgi:competence protein ComEA
MDRKQIARDYLSFTRKERIGLLALVIAIIVVIILPAVIGNRQSTHQTIADTSWISVLKELEINDTPNSKANTFKSYAADDKYVYLNERTVNNSTPVPVLFYFDPNTLDEAGWEKLGLKTKTIHTIRNYLARGGHFNKAEDLKKIYGLSAGDYTRLERFISIHDNNAAKEPTVYERKENPRHLFSYNSIDINTADTTAFISLPGIGGKLAARIVTFREKLGGFYSIAQIGETYGLADSTFQKIRQYLKIDNIPVKKININTATLDELKAHPYIKYSIANPIVAYRNEHGQFSSIEEIRKVLAVTSDVYTKIAPYLTLQ